MEGAFPYWLIHIAKFFLTVLDKLLDAIWGKSILKGSSNERKLAVKEGRTAHMTRVLMSARLSKLQYPGEHQFLHIHDAYIDPKFILTDVNITLCNVEPDYGGLFIVTDPDVDVYNTREFPFVYLSQTDKAQKLIKVPLDTFHDLADKLGDPSVPTALIGMTARCGSTLLCQMLNLVPGVRVLSEPWSLTLLHEKKTKRDLSEVHRKHLIQSALRLHYKVEPGSNVTHIVIKGNPFLLPNFPEIREALPATLLFFNTRHPMPSLRSYQQVVSVYQLDFHTFSCGTYRFVLMTRMCFPSDEKYDLVMQKFTKFIPNMGLKKLSAYAYAASVLCYFDNKDIYDGVILYENMAKNPSLELSKMFNMLNIEEKHIPTALEALKFDSQNGTYGTQGKNRNKVFKDSYLKTVDGVFDELGLPFNMGDSEKKYVETFQERNV